MLKQFKNRAFDAFRIKATLGMEFNLLTVFHHAVGDTQSHHLCMVVVIGHELKDGASETALNTSVLDRHYFGIMPEHFVQQFFIQRLNKPHVIMPNSNPLCFQFITHFNCIVSDVANG